ncbi:MAG: hypothetical protein NTW51_11665 [Cyanobacteria bacterium]|nr:hypothetical protein [Cyanobacteriota bacterium]
MPITRHRRSAVVLVAAALGSVATLAVSSPAQALTISTFSDSADAVTPTPDAIFGGGKPASGLSKVGSSFSFNKSGIQVTFSDPLKSMDPAVSRSTSVLGTCLGGQRPASVAVCGNDPNGPTPELNKITLTFNKAVKLLSAAGVTRSVVGDTMGDNIISSVWTTPGSIASFNATNSDNTVTPGDVTLDPFDFMFSNFIAQANVPVTVETSFTQGKLDYWVQNLKVEAAHVPGPLPLLGVGTAFAYSRRIRRRCKAASRIELV